MFMFMLLFRVCSCVIFAISRLELLFDVMLECASHTFMLHGILKLIGYVAFTYSLIILLRLCMIGAFIPQSCVHVK